jgi:hypothetical protein
MKKYNAKRRPSGRPSSSNSVRVVPVFRKQIDVPKLGRAALRLVMETSAEADINMSSKTIDSDAPSEPSAMSSKLPDNDAPNELSTPSSEFVDNKTSNITPDNNTATTKPDNNPPIGLLEINHET